MVYDIDLQEFRKVIEDAFSDVGITVEQQISTVFKKVRQEYTLKRTL